MKNNEMRIHVTPATVWTGGLARAADRSLTGKRAPPPLTGLNGRLGRRGRTPVAGEPVRTEQRRSSRRATKRGKRAMRHRNVRPTQTNGPYNNGTKDKVAYERRTCNGKRAGKTTRRTPKGHPGAPRRNPENTTCRILKNHNEQGSTAKPHQRASKKPQGNPRGTNPLGQCPLRDRREET